MTSSAIIKGPMKRIVLSDHQQSVKAGMIAQRAIRADSQSAVFHKSSARRAQLTGAGWIRAIRGCCAGRASAGSSLKLSEQAIERRGGHAKRSRAGRNVLQGRCEPGDKPALGVQRLGQILWQWRHEISCET